MAPACGARRLLVHIRSFVRLYPPVLSLSLYVQFVECADYALKQLVSELRVHGSTSWRPVEGAVSQPELSGSSCHGILS